MRATSSFEHAGLSIEIDGDPAPHSPRDAIDCVGHLAFWHPTILLGDEPPLAAGGTADSVASVRSAALWLPIWVSESDAGLELRVGTASDPAVESADGLIYATASDIKRRIKLYRLSRRALQEARALMVREVEDYEQWLRRELLQFVIHDRTGALIERRGDYRSLAGAREDAIRLAEHHAALLRRHAPERLGYRVSSRER